MISLWRKCLSGKCCPWPGCFSSIQNLYNWLTADISQSKSLWMLLTSTFRFHNSWLRFCCQCEKCKQAHSGQRTIDVLSVGDPIELSDFSVSSKCSLKQYTYYSLSKLITCQEFKYKKLHCALLHWIVAAEISAVEDKGCPYTQSESRVWDGSTHQKSGCDNFGGKRLKSDFFLKSVRFTGSWFRRHLEKNTAREQSGRAEM